MGKGQSNASDNEQEDFQVMLNPLNGYRKYQYEEKNDAENNGNHIKYP
jgi:hypothetical protein